MCGIVGCWTYKSELHPDLPGSISKATDSLAHRGPDDRGIWTDNDNGVFFGHRRLSIIDLSPAGHQPMLSNSGRVCIVFNGEIYNHVELHKSLVARNYPFKGNSDTEVILALYEFKGIDFIHELRGMFALAIWDKQEHRLILARDRVGKKPLYYATCNDGIYFASEINVFKYLLPRSEFKIDRTSLDIYLSLGMITGERTIYENIRELPPGTVLTCNNPADSLLKRYWQVNWHKKEKVSFEESIERTDNLLRESIKLRLRSDVPVGVLLSGGIDSGLITAIAARLHGGVIRTFCVGFENSSYDERPLARIVSEQYGTDHHEIVLCPDIASSLPGIIAAYGEPFADASAIPSYFVAQYATKHTKVVLNGDGGDELFCGYRRYVAAALLDKIRSFCPSIISANIASILLQILPLPGKHRAGYEFIHRLLRGLSQGKFGRKLVFSFDGFKLNQKKHLYKQEKYSRSDKDLFTPNLHGLFELNELDALIAIDFESGLPDDLLVKMDIATMAHGLEARSPFLDQEIVEWAFSIPGSVKLSGLKTKPILRSLAERYLPLSIVNAPKRGFEIPLRHWLENDLREMCHDLILSRTGLVSELFHRQYLESLLTGSEKGKLESYRWTNLVWILLVLAIWDGSLRTIAIDNRVRVPGLNDRNTT